MRKAVFAILAVFSSVGMATDESPPTEQKALVQLKNTEETQQSALAGCGGGGARARRGRRCSEGKCSEVARCGGGRRRRAPEQSESLLAGKCKGGNCNRGRGTQSLA